MEDLRAFIKGNFEKIQENIEKACLKSGRSPSEVKILGASKKQSPEKIKIAYELGITLFGENYVQEGEKKIKALESLEIEWHFIGRLQTNKVKKALKLFKVIQSLDRIELAEKIQKEAEKLEIEEVPVFVEVNIGKEKTKAGILPEELEGFFEKVTQGFPRLKICGLMCLPPYFENPEKTRPYFSEMRKLFEKFKPFLAESFKELSMGTSTDYVVAVEEGATIVRIGESLFGKRQ